MENRTHEQLFNEVYSKVPVTIINNNTMQLTPEFLPVGSIVEYNYNNEFGKMPVVIYGTQPPMPRKEPRFDGKWLVDIWVDGTTYITAPLDDCKPIPLTEKILTDWCGWKEMYRSPMHLTLEFEIKDGEFIYCYEWYNDDGSVKSKYVQFKGLNLGDLYLHQLQHLYSALTQTVLPIQIK